MSVCLAPLGKPVVSAKSPLSDRKLDAYAFENEIPCPEIKSNCGVDPNFSPLTEPTTLALKLSRTIKIRLVFESYGSSRDV